MTTIGEYHAERLTKCYHRGGLLPADVDGPEGAAGGRKWALGTRVPMTPPQHMNKRWSLNFFSDAFACGGRPLILCVVNDVTGEGLALLADTSLSGGNWRRKS